jgi:hypothetical protein
MSNLFEQASLIVTPNAVKAGKLYSIKPTSGAGDLDVVRATTKTRTNSLGVIENVPINVPALDYTNGSCPSILVEPQRTNLKPRSNDWTNSTFTLTNVTQSQSLPQPLFGTTALRVRETTANSSHAIIIQPDAVLVIGQVYTRSFYVKPTANRTVFNFRSSGQALNDCIVNLSTKTVISKEINVGNVFFKDQIDGIIRVEITFTATGTIGRPAITIFLDDSTSSYVGDINEGIDLYHIQYELGVNATSSIITLASTVTRNADVISKTGISDLIGQSEGTLFIDLDFKAINLANGIISVGDGGIANRMFLSCTSLNGISAVVRNSTGFQYSFTSSSQSTGRKKIALVYKQNDFAFFINGVLINSSSSGVLPLNISSFNFDVGATGSKENYLNNVLFFKTRLTNQQCIALTTL